MLDHRPLVRKFKADDGHFVYDVGTNNILSVDDRFFSIIDHIRFESSDGGIKPAFVPRDESGTVSFPDDEVRLVLDEVGKYRRERGFFADVGPSRLMFPFSRDELQLILNNLLGHVILDVTENCNLRCSYCKFSGTYPLARTHSERKMDKSVAIRAVDYMLQRVGYIVEHTKESVSIGFYGGEPLLNLPVIRACVEHVDREYAPFRGRIGYSLTTNLVLGDDKALDYLVDHDFSLTVSLDGPKHLHDRYRSFDEHRGSFDRIMANLDRIRNRSASYYNQRVGFSAVLAPPYDLPAVVEFFSAPDLPTNGRLLVSYVDADDTTFFDQFSDLEAINRDVAAQVESLTNRLKAMLIRGNGGREKEVLLKLFGEPLRDIHFRHSGALPDNVWPNGICLPGFQRFCVSPDGRFYMCEKIGRALPIGDLESGLDVGAILENIKEYIALSEPRCLDCWAQRLCKVCFLRALKGNRFDRERKDENCRAVKRSVLGALQTYCEVMSRNPGAFGEAFGEVSIAHSVDLAFQFVEDYRRQKGILAIPTATSAECAG